jgi:uncharacterized protein YdiU (UPF0061 family)
MSPYQQAQQEIENLKRQVEMLTQMVKTENAGAIAALTLERNQYRDRYEMKNQLCNDLMADRMGLVSENRDLQEDKILLDWFEENNHHVTVDFPPGAHLTTSSWAFYAPRSNTQQNSMRDCLRAAIVEYGKPLVGGLFGNKTTEDEDA